MYSIILKDGNIININATEVEWCEQSRTVRFIEYRHAVARTNMDAIIGYIDTDNTVENENENPLKWFPARENVGGIRVPKSFIVRKRLKNFGYGPCPKKKEEH